MPEEKLPRPVLHSVLGRAGFGATAAEIALVEKIGFRAWVEEQLRPGSDDCADRMARLTLKIKYAAQEKWPAVDEQRPLQWLNKPIEAAWPLYVNRQEQDGAERRRPLLETAASTVLRAVHSKWQLREVLVEFWHDHFNVDGYGSEAVGVALPSYDRDVIRRHALGNFREFLEATATSAAMQYYLSNRSSRAGSANENYARELFELHGLGREAYLNDRYSRWRDVPGALNGAPTGYIDQDVYEAARALTGWTIEDGSGLDGQRKLPQTGRFAYVEAWHDGYQKRVLGVEFPPFQKAMADGRQVLDLVAHHPATARHLCGKLCLRLIGEGYSPAALAAATSAWTQHRAAPDQIGQTVRAILLTPDFLKATGGKARRPMALVAAFARGIDLDLTPTDQLLGELNNAGQRLFGYPPPTGLPDARDQFLGANAMRRRWGLALGLAENHWGTGSIDFRARFQGVPTPRAATAQFLAELTGSADPVATFAIVNGLGWPPDAPIAEPGSPDLNKRLARLAAYAAMAPAFQTA